MIFTNACERASCRIKSSSRRFAFAAIALLVSASGLQAQYSLSFDGANDYVTFGPAQGEEGCPGGITEISRW
ncbi:MAG: hypothetical protein ACR2OZ_09340 [Verrucomicrobiales bacterium]